MRGKVIYVGSDPDLPAFLSAYGTGGFQVTALTPGKYRREAADLLLWDLDAAPLPSDLPAGTRVVTVGYRGDADLCRPFLFSDFEKILDPDAVTGAPVLSDAGRDLFCGGARVRLSPLEYDLYATLSGAAGTTVAAAALCKVGGRDLTLHALGVALSALRKKLERLPDPPVIRADRGEGYRLQTPDAKGQGGGR